MMTVLYALLFYGAAAIFAGGLAHKLVQYTTTSAPLKIPTTPAPLTGGGVALRLAREVVFFESLFKASKWTWLFGFVFHAALLVVLLRHLRYFTEPVWSWVVLIQPFGIYGGFAMVLGLLGLGARRLLVERVRYISNPSDHLMILLLVLIGLTGLGMRYLAPTDIVAAKAFVLGLLYFDWQPLPADPLLWAHFGLVILLMIIFPFSKLLHAPGLFFSPTRNQADDAREKRHVASWAAPLDIGRDV